MKSIVKKNLFDSSTLDLSLRLLGMELVHKSKEGLTSGKIVEVEAYKGPHDKAAHSYNNRRTKRTEVMYGPAGHAYMFRIYGMYICFNIVCAGESEPEAILVRALEPIDGIPLMQERRGNRFKLEQLTNGPGKLCQAMGLTMNHYGHDLTLPPLYLLEQSEQVPETSISTGPRINIDYAEEARDYPWRYWITGNRFVSKE